MTVRGHLGKGKYSSSHTLDLQDHNRAWSWLQGNYGKDLQPPLCHPSELQKHEGGGGRNQRLIHTAPCGACWSQGDLRSPPVSSAQLCCKKHPLVSYSLLFKPPLLNHLSLVFKFFFCLSLRLALILLFMFLHQVYCKAFFTTRFSHITYVLSIILMSSFSHLFHSFLLYCNLP